MLEVCRLTRTGRTYLALTRACACMHAESHLGIQVLHRVAILIYNIHFYQYGINLAMCDSTLFGGLV